MKTNVLRLMLNRTLYFMPEMRSAWKLSLNRSRTCKAVRGDDKSLVHYNGFISPWTEVSMQLSEVVSEVNLQPVKTVHTPVPARMACSPDPSPPHGQSLGIPWTQMYACAHRGCHPALHLACFLQALAPADAAGYGHLKGTAEKGT